MYVRCGGLVEEVVMHVHVVINDDEMKICGQFVAIELKTIPFVLTSQIEAGFHPLYLSKTMVYGQSYLS